MPFKAYPPDGDGIILVRVWGKAGLETGRLARAATSELAQNHKVSSILVDFRETRIVAPLHEYLEYYRDTANHYPPGTRLALVISEQTVPSTEADMELTRVVSLAGGLALQDFRDMDEARAWLLRP